jgi:signal-transduction protein with cAMP-binding, CBS, and nucleotidyltransferase domain
MSAVRDLLRHKGGSVHCLPADATVGQAAKQLHMLGIGALIIGTTDAWVGLISERDIVGHLAVGCTRDAMVTACMTKDLITVQPKDSLAHCSSVMTDQRIRHLPVIQGQEMIGVISIGDVVRCLSAEKDFELEQLGQYITGNYPAAG